MWEIKSPVPCLWDLGLVYCISYSALVDTLPCREVFLWTALRTSLEEGFLLGRRFCFNSELNDEDRRFFSQAKGMWIQGARQNCIYIYHNNHNYMAFVLCLESRESSGFLDNYQIVVESCALQHSTVWYISKVQVDIPGTAEVSEWCFSFWESLSLLSIGTVDSRSELCLAKTRGGSSDSDFPPSLRALGWRVFFPTRCIGVCLLKEVKEDS